MQPTTEQPPTGAHPVLTLQEKYREQAERARDHQHVNAVIAIPPGDLLQMIGQGNDREKLIICNRENEANKYELRNIDDQLARRSALDGIPTRDAKIALAIATAASSDRHKRNLDNLTGGLEKLLFNTANSHGADDVLHSQLLTLLRQFKPEAGTAHNGN